MQAVRAHATFKGRVQGVCYRMFVREEAGALGLSGWVRNCLDGSVEAVVEGERERIELLFARCKEGPPLARVREILTSWETATGEFNGFSIKH